MAAKAIEKLFKFAVSRADADTLIKIGAKLKLKELVGAATVKIAEDQAPPKTIEESLRSNAQLAPAMYRYTRANRPSGPSLPEDRPFSIADIEMPALPNMPKAPSMPIISDDSLLRDIGNAIANKYESAVNAPLQKYFQDNFDFVPANVNSSIESNRKYQNTGQRYKDISDRDTRAMQNSQLRALNLAFKNNATPEELAILADTFRRQKEQTNTIDSSRASALESIVSPVDLSEQERRRRQLLRSLGY